jgi:hypothetical protein
MTAEPPMAQPSWGRLFYVTVTWVLALTIFWSVHHLLLPHSKVDTDPFLNAELFVLSLIYAGTIVEHLNSIRSQSEERDHGDDPLGAFLASMGQAGLLLGSLAVSMLLYAAYTSAQRPTLKPVEAAVQSDSVVSHGRTDPSVIRDSAHLVTPPTGSSARPSP